VATVVEQQDKPGAGGTPGSEIVETSGLNSADELLDALDPRDARWQPDPGRWVFRGHGSVTWKLSPTAHRAEAWKRFCWPDRQHDPTRASSAEQRKAETDILYRFFRVLDDSGLPIPGDYRALSDNLTHALGTEQGMPPPLFDAIMALARHVGLPSPLLDWSRFAKIAAYFAAYEGAKSRDSDSLSRFEVWAFTLDFVEKHGKREGYPEIRQPSVPQSSNPNLNAQGGICTHWDWRDNHVVTLDEAVALIVEAHRGGPQAVSLPVFRRLSVPVSEAGKTLRLLACEGVHAARLFPGHTGVVRHIEEQGLWDNPAAWRTW